MPANAVVPFLVAMMLVTGVCNTLLTKYQDMQCVRHCDSRRPRDRVYFEQPIGQTLQMFIGEMGCWLVVGGFALYTRYAKTSGGYRAVPVPGAAGATPDHPATDAEIVAAPLKPAHNEHEGRIPLVGWNIALLALPAAFDITATTLMNVGLLFVAASIYQMTRGALVLFVGLFSVVFLGRRLGAVKWLALFVVVAGVAIVGLAGAIAKHQDGGEAEKGPEQASFLAFVGSVARRGLEHMAEPALGGDGGGGGGGVWAQESDIPGVSPAARTVIGVLLIAGAQVFTASQFVIEESIMEKYAMEPIRVVGWEGIFGFLFTVIVMGVMHAAVGRTPAGRNGYFDAREGLYQMTHHRAVAVSSVLIMVSIGGFNFFGLSVTRSVSATSRSTIDTCRTLFIWIVSLGLGWESFKWLQVLGFALLVYGTFLFNEIVRPPFAAWVARWGPARGVEGGGEAERLLPEEPIEHR